MISIIKNITRFLCFNHQSLPNSSKKVEKEQREDFLKTLYHLGGEISVEKAFQVAKQLNIHSKTTPSIIGVLVLQGEVTAQKTLTLTPKGKKHALRLIRAHRIYEQYLAEHSGYAPSEWHERANKMEHNMNDEEQKRIAVFLGNPLFDPHGDPIPTQSLELITKENTSQPFREQSWWRITHVEDDDKDLFLQINEIGLTKDSIIFITSIDSRSFHFNYEGEQFCLPLNAQEALTKVEIANDEAAKYPETTAQRLTRISANQTALIAGLSPSCRGALRRRLMDLGFVKGSSVSIDLESPMKNPIAYVVRGTSIALRHDQARYILIKQ